MAETVWDSLSDRGARLATEMWQHVKSGGFYRIVTWGRIEADLSEVVIYRAEKDGTVWVRPKDEFFDGRFVRVPNGKS